MGLKPTFKLADVRAKLNADAKKIEQVILLRLQYLGEECVNIARNLDTYKDQTGNLRNSVGYVIARNGKVVLNNFQRSAKVVKTSKSGRQRVTSGSGDGVKIGESLALDLISGHGRGYVLIVVAGMDYAEAVEMRGNDVLSSAEQYAKKELPRMKAALRLDVMKLK